MYTKIKKSILLRNNTPVWNPILCEHIANEIHGGTYEYSQEDLEKLPHSIQNLHFLWRAQCEIGGSGFNYLYQAEALEIIGIYNAFVEAEAFHLVNLMANAIALANQKTTAEYHDAIEGTSLIAWFNKFTDIGIFNDLEDTQLNEQAWELVEDYLDEKILNYIKKNIAEIAE